MGDSNSKEEVIEKVVEDEKAKNGVEEKQDSPPLFPKLLSLLKSKDQPPDKDTKEEEDLSPVAKFLSLLKSKDQPADEDGAGEKEGSSTPMPKLLSLLKAKEQGNFEVEHLIKRAMEANQLDYDLEIIEIAELYSKIKSSDTVLRDKKESDATKLLLDNKNIKENESDEIELRKQESLTLLEILQSGKDSDFQKSTTKPKIAEVLKNKDWEAEWKVAVKSTSEPKSTTPKLLHFMKNDDFQARLGQKDTRNSHQISVQKDDGTEKAVGATESKDGMEKSEDNSSDVNVTENHEGNVNYSLLIPMHLHSW